MAKKIIFPKDEQRHNSSIEWWYLNGHLQDKNKNNYAYMNCLFKADIKKTKIPFFEPLPFKEIWFSHSILTDIKKQKFYPEVNYISLISEDSFSKPFLFINCSSPSIFHYFNSIIEETRKFNYHLKTRFLDLNLISKKNPLLVGGKGFIKLHSKSTYYYSLTDLKTNGEIVLKDKRIRVKGKSWMDHQWANVSYSEDKWTWFSIQLDQGIDLLCFKYESENKKDFLASIIYKNGKQEHTKNLILIPKKTIWRSKKTGNIYNIEWDIRIPEKDIYLQVKPLIKNQEINFGTINYWEGPLSVSGQINNNPVNGKGFLEIVGRPSHYSVDVLKDIFKSIKKFL